MTVGTVASWSRPEVGRVVRQAQLRDLANIDRLYRQGVRAHASEAGPPGSGPVGLWFLATQTLAAILPTLYPETSLHVLEGPLGRLGGFVQAGARNTGPLTGVTSWQVLNLCVDDSQRDADAVADLLDQLSNQALARGVVNLFVRLPDRDPMLPAFRMQGFRQYATEQVFYTEQPELSEVSTPPGGLRPVKRKDAALIYNLYRRVTPLGVALVEAPSIKTWRSQYPVIPERRAPREASERQTVIDRSEMLAWSRWKPSSATRPHTISITTVPDQELADQLVDWALAVIGPACGPVWSSVRHYDSHMMQALRSHGFGILTTQCLLVRQLAKREPVHKKAWVPQFG